MDKRITLHLVECDYKYDMEAVLKLFFPATNFNFTDSSEKPVLTGDFCLVRERKYRNHLWFGVSVSINSKKSHKSSRLPLNADRRSRIAALGRLLYHALSPITGIHPSWGTLTGVRPVKHIHKLLENGSDKAMAFTSLKDTYLVSEEKLELAYDTAMTQKPLLAIPEKSFSLYLSIPFCPTRCTYCSFVSHDMKSAGKLLPDYLKCLEKELIYTAAIAEKLGLKLDTVYFGGGTPTVLSAEELSHLMEIIRTHYDLSDLREYTVEAGRPDTITAEKLTAIKSGRASRVSINPQSLNDSVLEAIGRKHTALETIEAYKLAREVGFESINTDLIAGLPTDTPESFQHTINEILRLKPENITVHTLSLKRSAHMYYQPRQLSHEFAAEMVAMSSRALKAQGYRPYYLYRQKNTLGNLENVGYALPGFESPYNIAIMEEVQTILAVGAGSVTKVVRGEEIDRVYNYKFPHEYIKKFPDILKKKDEVISLYIQGRSNPTIKALN